MIKHKGYLTSEFHDALCGWCNKEMTNQKVVRVSNHNHRKHICVDCNAQYQHNELQLNEESFYTNFNTLSEIIQILPKRWLHHLLHPTMKTVIDLNPYRKQLFYTAETDVKKEWARAEKYLFSSKNLCLDNISELTPKFFWGKRVVRQIPVQFLGDNGTRIRQVMLDAAHYDKDTNIYYVIEQKSTTHSHLEGLLQAAITSYFINGEIREVFYINTKTNEYYMLDATQLNQSEFIDFLNNNGFLLYNQDINAESEKGE